MFIILNGDNPYTILKANLKYLMILLNIGCKKRWSIAMTVLKMSH